MDNSSPAARNNFLTGSVESGLSTVRVVLTKKNVTFCSYKLICVVNIYIHACNNNNDNEEKL